MWIVTGHGFVCAKCGIPSVVVVNVGSFVTLSVVLNIEYIQHYSMDMQSGKIVAFKNKM